MRARTTERTAPLRGGRERQRRESWQLSETLIAHGLIASIGTLYPMLSRLRTQGLVSTYEQASDAGPVRKYYRVTDAGTAQLNIFREQWGLSPAPFTTSSERTTTMAKATTPQVVRSYLT